MFERYMNLLYRLCYSILLVREDAEDAVQEAVFSAWRNIHSLKDAALFKGWIFKILSNRCKTDLMKKNKAPDVLPVEEYEFMVEGDIEKWRNGPEHWETTAMVKSYNHHKLEAFGAGEEKDAAFWNAVIRQALIMGLVDKNIENYGLISINDKGREYIKSPKAVTITLDHNYDDEEKEEEVTSAQMGKGGAADEELFSMLKDLRKKVAKKHDLPPFVIFQDPSLEDMAIQYPITIEEMQNISGVGAGKAKKFGEEFVKLIKAYVEDKDIIRPQDMVVKGVANKSGNKIFIIQSIDRKMDFEDIARAKNLEFEELLSDIEGIVNSGTKLDISYYLDNHMDEDKVEDIYLYFKEDAESDSLEDAIEELGSDYSEEEIRLVRIKFLCEVGN